MLDIQIKPTKIYGDEKPTALINGKYIHSSYDPLKEAESILARKDLRNTDIIFIFGLGLGYLIEKLIDKKRDIFIIGIEKNKFFKKFLQKFENFLNVKIFIDSEVFEIIKFLHIIAPEWKNIDFIQNDILVENDRDYYKKLREEVILYFKRRVAEITTDAYFNSIWLFNTIRNLKKIKKFSFLKDYKGHFKGKEGILISAGPLVEKYIKIISNTNIYKFALPPAVPILLKNNIKIDFVVSSDANFYNIIHFKKFINENLNLITEPIIHPSILYNFRGRVIFFDHNLKVSFILKKIIGDIGYIPMGGTVAISAIFIAKYLGFKKLYLLGQDFNIIDLKTHCKGSGYEIYNLINSNKFDTILNKYFKFIKEGDLINKLKMYKNWFELIYPDIGIEIENISDYKIGNLKNVERIIYFENERVGIEWRVYNLEKELEFVLKKLKEKFLKLREEILRIIELGDFYKVIDLLYSDADFNNICEMLLYREFLQIRRGKIEVGKEFLENLLEKIERFIDVL